MVSIKFASSDENIVINEAQLETLVPNKIQRPTRRKQVLSRFNDCEIIYDNVMDEGGEIIHFSMLVGEKPSG